MVAIINGDCLVLICKLVVSSQDNNEGELYCALEGGRDCGEKAKKRSAYLSHCQEWVCSSLNLLC